MRVNAAILEQEKVIDAQIETWLQAGYVFTAKLVSESVNCTVGKALARLRLFEGDNTAKRLFSYRSANIDTRQVVWASASCQDTRQEALAKLAGLRAQESAPASGPLYIPDVPYKTTFVGGRNPWTKMEVKII